jgi:hypothetical protein
MDYTTYRVKDIPGVVTRKLPRDLVGRDLYGKNIVITHECVTCGYIGPASAFPLDSKAKRRNDNHVRRQCVICHNKYRGKLRPIDNTEPSSTLMMFLNYEIEVKEVEDARRLSMGREV